MNPRVAVVMGGPSHEHDVSLKSGAQVMRALAGEGARAVLIQKDGQWRIDEVPQGSVGQALDHLRATVDVAVIALHGPFGEDGTIQGMLEGFGIRYTGSGVAASALAMDKLRTKRVYRACGLPTPDFEALDRRQWQHKGRIWLQEVGERLGYPLVVKPLKNGSSFGVSFPKNADELLMAVERLVAEGNDLLLERYIKGREATCGVLEWGATKIEALPVTEIIPNPEFEFFDYVAKYTPGATQEITPAPLPEPMTREVQRLALEAHLALGCRDLSRTDVMIDPVYGPMLLETNTLPGMTGTSLLPQAAAVIGLDFRSLVKLLINNALSR